FSLVDMLKSSLLRGLRLPECKKLRRASRSSDASVATTLSTVSDLSRRSADPTKTVEVRGWVKRSHKTGGMTFAHVSDGLSTETVQVVVPRSVCSSLPLGSGIVARGLWKESSGSQQACELEATEATVMVKDSDPRYSSLTPDQLRKSLPMRSRSDDFSALLRMRSRLTMATHRFFQDAKFVHVDTPILTANDCEGAGETFVVKLEGAKDDSFFGHDVFLSVSSQLHLEAVTAGISRVYTIARAFRAEKNQSSTHMSEFSMLEIEVSLCESLDEIMDIAESYIRAMARELCSTGDASTASGDAGALGAYSDMARQLFGSLSKMERIPRIRHAEALRVLKEIGHKLPESGALSRSAELALVYHFHGPVFVTHFPADQKPFYMKRTEQGETESFDLLCPFVGELAGGSLRVSTREQLERQCPDGKLPEALKWYAAMRERGKPPSGGFGIGFERLLQTLLEIRNIKDTTAFPRWFKQCKC
ncbi:hypothetical protein PFISCL1PPCAC_12211, partial [Pristionchus fissidentatus]